MSAGPAELERAASELSRRIALAVARAVEGENTVAVAFSGGVDSSVLAACAKRHGRVIACTGYSDRSRDGARSAAAADALGIELVATRLTEESVARELSRMELPFAPTLMDRSLWCLYSVAAQSAKAAGSRVMLLGQLADELFGGYAKYASALEAGGEEAARSLMESDFDGYAHRGKIRDVGACSPWVQPRFPYADEDLVKQAASIPLSYKITPTSRKEVLRRAAVLLGVPEGIATAPKKAAQYSSGSQKLVAGSRF
ncbi:MAG: asparagine synthase [Nitrososphaerota archaeon]|nr:asparagine synthase [Nitrososphaerota archaeon]MDG6982900.1 asparagine synthase [Nitrososphaerota archaeon]